MNSPLVGPGDRYRLAVEALASRDGVHFTRHVAEAGVPLGGGSGGWPSSGEAPGAPPRSYLVIVDEVCSLILQPGENGLTVRDIRLLNATQARLAARVIPGSAPPDWLPGESSYLLFDGDSKATQALPARYVPLDGLAAPDTWPPSDTAPLDVLAVAVGRSVERANAILACRRAPGGTALVSSLTIRVGLSQVNLGQNRVLVTLAPPNGEADQFVELTLTSAFAAAEAELEAEAITELGAAGGAAGLVGPGGLAGEGL